jgi:hypothetical protein
MYKKELPIGEQMPVKRITEDYLPLITFYLLLLKIYLVKEILSKISFRNNRLEKSSKQPIIKC